MVKMFSLLQENLKFPVQNQVNLVIYGNKLTDFKISGRRNKISGIVLENSNSHVEILNFENE